MTYEVSKLGNKVDSTPEVMLTGEEDFLRAHAYARMFDLWPGEEVRITRSDGLTVYIRRQRSD